MRLLLDTCTFLWLVGDAKELSARARDAFADPTNEAFLSAASAWEIAVKHRLGKLPLPSSPDEFVPAQREAHGIELLVEYRDSFTRTADGWRIARREMTRVIDKKAASAV